MKAIFLFTAVFFVPFVSAQTDQTVTASGLVTYSNRPLGSPSQPLILRTFMPNPELGKEVLARHHLSSNSPKYNPTEGKDVAGFYRPIDGLPAAIGVNYGAELSYCWDSVECRLLYAWRDGFLDMQVYWGDPERGSRQAFGYVPHLVGTVYYKASGKDPLLIDGKSVSDLESPPKFIGYDTHENGFIFTYLAGGVKVYCEVTKGQSEYGLVVRYRCEGDATLGYRDDLPNHHVKTISQNELLVSIEGAKISEYHGNPKTDLLEGGVNIASGERIFDAMACGSCHSLDGSESHGPSLLGLHGKTREITGLEKPIVVDDAYILESIREPNAKLAVGYPPNYMPPYTLKDAEYQALLLYLKSITP